MKALTLQYDFRIQNIHIAQYLFIINHAELCHCTCTCTS